MQISAEFRFVIPLPKMCARGSGSPDCGAAKPSRSQTLPNKRNAVQHSCSDQPKTACQNGYWVALICWGTDSTISCNFHIGVCASECPATILHTIYQNERCRFLQELAMPYSQGVFTQCAYLSSSCDDLSERFSAKIGASLHFSFSDLCSRSRTCSS